MVSLLVGEAIHTGLLTLTLKDVPRRDKRVPAAYVGRTSTLFPARRISSCHLITQRSITWMHLHIDGGFTVWL